MIHKNAFSWIEIPVADLDRAQKFYEAILDIQMIPLDFPDMKMRMFPIEDMAGVGVRYVIVVGFTNHLGLTVH